MCVHYISFKLYTHGNTTSENHMSLFYRTTVTLRPLTFRNPNTKLFRESFKIVPMRGLNLYLFSKKISLTWPDMKIKRKLVDWVKHWKRIYLGWTITILEMVWKACYNYLSHCPKIKISMKKHLVWNLQGKYQTDSQSS